MGPQKKDGLAARGSSWIFAKDPMIVRVQAVNRPEPADLGMGPSRRVRDAFGLRLVRKGRGFPGREDRAAYPFQPTGAIPNSD